MPKRWSIRCSNGLLAGSEHGAQAQVGLISDGSTPLGLPVSFRTGAATGRGVRPPTLPPPQLPVRTPHVSHTDLTPGSSRRVSGQGTRVSFDQSLPTAAKQAAKAALFSR